MFNPLKWLVDRQRRECDKELDLRLTGPLPETTNVCLLRLVEPVEPDPQEESMIEAMEGDDG